MSKGKQGKRHFRAMSQEEEAGIVESKQGKQSGWDNRMGPYDTEAEARQALDTAAKRTEAADAKEAEEEDWGKPPAWEK